MALAAAAEKDFDDAVALRARKVRTLWRECLLPESLERRECARAVFVPSVTIHLLGHHAIFFGVPFSASWLWHHLEGSDLPGYPAKRDKATGGHIGWAG